MKKAAKILFVLSGLILSLVLLDKWLYYHHAPRWEPAFISVSPDERFTVSVYYNSGIFTFFPLPLVRPNDGTVVLRENKTGKVLVREITGFVDSVTPTVRWGTKTNSVSVVSVGVWDLPPEEPGK
jgi:hypothetical protein